MSESITPFLFFVILFLGENCIFASSSWDGTIPWYSGTGKSFSYLQYQSYLEFG